MAETNQAIINVVDAVNKKFGKGSIVNFEESVPDVEFIRSGSLGLDHALGGGFAKGRIVEIYGPESSGKCLNSGSYILTATGYKTVKEIFNENGLELFSVFKDVPIQYSLINRFGEIELTTHFTYNAKKPLIRVTTNSGFKQERTFKHPLLVISNNGNLVWRWTGEIKVGDYLVQRRDCHFGQGGCPNETAYAIGLLLADGCLSDGLPSVSNNDPSVVEFIENKLTTALGVDSVYLSGKSECKDGSISYSYEIRYKAGTKNFYSKFDLKQGVAKYKTVPKWIRELSSAPLAAFIRGFMDSEGCTVGEVLGTSSASFGMLYQIKLILSQFGIVSFIDKCAPTKGYEQNDYWRLEVYGKDYEKYIKLIGTDSSKHKTNHDFFINRTITQVQTNHDSVPFINSVIKDLYHIQDKRTNEFCKLIEDVRYDEFRCSYTKLIKILEISQDCVVRTQLEILKDYYFDEVVNVESIEPEPTFDFAMQDTSSFIADGCINHNTTLALHAMAEAHKAGGVCAFIDAEHAFDPKYAETLGVDLSKEAFLFSQPSSGEEALEIAEMLIKTGKLDIVVIDSVAALTPKAELEGEMGDSKMGLQARLMSQALRKITGSVSKTGTLVIFINQLREKIGVMFGNPETTTGGNALKFYASQRLDIRRVSINKEGDESVSNTVKVKVVKNKTAPPFRTATFNLVYGHGIDRVVEIVTLGVELGVIQKSGSWYSYDGSKLGQGAEGVKSLLVDNPDLLEELQVIISQKLK